VATLIVLLVLGVIAYWANKFANRRDAQPGAERPDAARSATPANVNRPPPASMLWTAVDDRQFRRLIDGMSPDHGG
jgi:hypothetical protein